MKIPSNLKNSLVVFCLIIVTLGVIILIVYPLINACLKTYTINKDKQAEIASYDKNIQNLQNIEAKVADINYTIQKAEEFIPKEDNIGDFIVQLEATVKKSSVTLQSINFEQPNTASQSQPQTNESSANQPNQEQNQSSTSQNTNQPAQLINIQGANQKLITVETNSSYPDFVIFLSKMRRLARFNIIKNLSLESAEKGGKITASFTVIIFSKP
jgi:Tfp pilus assembly protein PilO